MERAVRGGHAGLPGGDQDHGRPAAGGLPAGRAGVRSVRRQCHGHEAGPDKLVRSELDDDHYGAVAHFTDSTDDSPGFAEIFDEDVKAPLGGFGDPYAYDVWISTADDLGDVAVRELGHTLGLSDTARPDALTIMTKALSKKDARGAHGSYRGRLELRSNHEANSDSRARILPLDDGRASAYGEFVKVLKAGTGNWYRFDAAPGPISLSVTPQQPYSALELEAALYDADLKLIKSADSVRNNEIEHVGTKSRTYFVKVEQAAAGGQQKAATKIATPRYGNLGVYQLAVRAEAAAELPPPTAVDPSDGSVVTGTGVPGAKIEVQDSLDNIVATGTVAKNGTYTVKLTNVFSGEELMVRQSKDGKRSRPISIDVDTSVQIEIVVKINPRTITEGYDRDVIVTGENFDSDQTVHAVVRRTSGPVVLDLGTQSSADRGRVEFRFDASSLEPGKYTVGLGADRDYAGSSTLNVRKAEKPSPKPTDSPKPSSEPTDDPGDDDELPATGAGSDLALAGLGGLVLIGAGAAIALAARRRNRA